MKKLNLWGMMMLAVVMALLTACSKGDDGGSGTPIDPDNPDPNAIMTFNDPVVNALCVQNFDRNNDGKLSYAEAAAVTDLGTVFYQKAITSFDELKYFKGLASIANKAFEGCSRLTSITIPNSVTSIGDDAFANCPKLSSITIPNSVTSIGIGAFASCSGLTYINIGNSVISIGKHAFYACFGLVSVTIPNSVASIDYAAFENCSGLTSVTIGSGLTRIGERAFASCSKLTSVTIPNSVATIGNYAFEWCKSLTSVTVLNPTPVAIDQYVFSNRNNATLYVPMGSKSAYQAANYWKEFKEIIEIN